MSNQYYWRTIPALFSLFLVGLLVTACQSTSSNQPTSIAASVTSPPSAEATSTPAKATALITGDFRTIVRQVAQQIKPAVVQITSERQVQLELLDRPFTVPAGVGSGVIYDRSGHILTNNHVVAGAQQLLVSLPDGRSFPGQLIGRDAQTDLAVVQIKGDNLPVAPLGDSKQLQVGDWVVAIGNALALTGGPTVTTGVVGALGRTVQEPGGKNSQNQGPFLFDVIQTDAPINPGNSGGPLVNLDGQVVGINTLVAGQAEPGVQAQGVGFAIGITTAKPIADQLVTTGHAVHPFLGIAYRPLSPPIAALLGLSVKSGVWVRQVAQGSPADLAGLQPRDVITEIDGTPLQDDSSLAQITNSHKPGDTLNLTVLRQKQKLSLSLKLQALPPS